MKDHQSALNKLLKKYPISDKDLEPAEIKYYNTRHASLMRVIQRGYSAILILSLSIPTKGINNSIVEEILTWGSRILIDKFPGIVDLDSSKDAAGRYIVFGVDNTMPISAKAQCINIETDYIVGHILNIDVYDVFGKKVSRRMLNKTRRICPICSDFADKCIRNNKHNYQALIEKIYQSIIESRS